MCIRDSIYTTLKGWNQNINDIKEFDKMPFEVKDYIDFIETYLGVPVTMLSTGPEREALIVRS